MTEDRDKFHLIRNIHLDFKLKISNKQSKQVDYKTLVVGALLDLFKVFNSIHHTFLLAKVEYLVFDSTEIN